MAKNWGSVKPPSGAQINWGHPLSKGLAFVSLLNEKAGGSRELITGTPPNQQDGGWSPEGIDCSAITSTQKGSQWAKAPIKTSSFDGNGNYSVLIIANPNSESAARTIFSQKNDALGFPYSQFWFASNSTDGANSTQNKISLAEYSGSGCYACGDYTFDGRYHVFVGIRKSGVLDVYVDGILKTTQRLGTAKTIWKEGQYTSIGSFAGTYNGGAFNKTVKLAIGFNRALTPSEIRSLYVSPYQFISRKSGGALKAPSAFENARAAIIAGLDSAQSEANGWDATVKTSIPVGNVVRTSDTVVTVTLPATASYDITATETITATIPASALTGAAQLVASPTFTIAPVTSGVVPKRMLMGVGV